MTETKHEVVNPLDWKEPKGYANGIAATGKMVFLGGQVGWNAKQEFETTDFVGQVDQVFENITTVLKQAGAKPQDVVRMTWYITNKKEYLSSQKELGSVYRKHFAKHFPAMALVQVAGLIEDGAKVEIEATAVIPNTPS